MFGGIYCWRVYVFLFGVPPGAVCVGRVLGVADGGLRVVLRLVAWLLPWRSSSWSLSSPSRHHLSHHIVFCLLMLM